MAGAAPTVTRSTALASATAFFYSFVTVSTVVIVLFLELFAGRRVAGLESLLLVLALAMGCLKPELGSWYFRSFESWIARTARKPVSSVLLVAAVVLLGRIALLVAFPAPIPRVHDEFSYLLACDTFSSGRLTNPTHSMWPFFESFQIDQQPTYMSMYPPAQGLFLAFGKRLTGYPFGGVLLSSAVMCASMYWAFRGWVPGRWALLGSLIVAFRIGILSYFANSYWGGAPAAIGGALVLGAFPRVTRTCRVRDAILLGLGLALLANSRPFEGAVVGVAFGMALAVWLLRAKGLHNRTFLLRVALPLVMVLALTAAAMGYYAARVFGDPRRMPYQINRATYAVAPVFPWLPLATPPRYRHEVMRHFYLGWEVEHYRNVRSISGRMSQTMAAAGPFWECYVGPALTLPFLLLPLVALDRRFRAPCLVGALLTLALAAEVFFQPHYAAPGAAVLFLLLLLGVRRLRLWRWHCKRTGLFLSRAILPICIAVLLVAAAAPGQFAQDRVHFGQYYFVPNATPRSVVLQRLQGTTGKHVVMVRYGAQHDAIEGGEWVYNDADIDRSQVVWARDMGAVENERLVRYFADRKIWLVEPDAGATRLRAYPGTPESGGR